MTELTSRFDAALIYASELHRKQGRKGSETPYVGHLLAVAGLVLAAGGSEDEAIAALLHDAPEDQGGEPVLAEIRQRFGDEVAEAVAGCTDTMVEPKPEWRPRKEAYIGHLDQATSSARLVSLADKVDNARAIAMDLEQLGPVVWDRFRGGQDGSLWYYRSILERFRALLGGDHPSLLRELELNVRRLEAFQANPPIRG